MLLSRFVLLVGLVQADTSILGTWRGTSTCVDKVAFPACHDEVVIYEIRSHLTAADSVIVRADKVVKATQKQ